MPAPDPVPNPITDPELREALTLDFLSGELHPAQLIRLHRISLDAFFAWWQHPEVQARIAHFRAILETHAQLAATTNAYEGRATLLCLARDLDQPEAARKSASLLFKARQQPRPAPAQRPAPPAPPPLAPRDHRFTPRFRGAAVPCHSSFGTAAFTTLLDEHGAWIDGPQGDNTAPPARVACHDA